ncbi:hypothetical protein, partial [Psychrobacter phenylpyruvicus]|uniref:hypothetical protein n=1 Tax=Psychrobacter phenylpyruvicus TaxID=29432 RepID=UPI0007AB2A44
MRKVILLISALFSAGMMSSAYAENKAPDCDSLNIMLMSMKDELNINANWRTTGSSPNKFKTVSVGDSNNSGDPSFDINCPNLTASYDGNALKMKADSYKGIIDHLYKQLNRGVDLYNYRWYTDPKVKADFKVDKYSFDLERLLLTDGYIKMPEGGSISKKQSFIPNTAVISYKINGGTLKPLLVNKNVTKYSSDFKGAKTIDIYHKNPNMARRGFGVERIFIDKENGVP